MLDRIIEILKENGADAWRITESENETAELYFVRKKLDMPRIKKMKLWNVDLFRDFEENGSKFRGSSNAILSPGMSESEIRDAIGSAYFAAAYVKNPYFDLPEGIQEDFIPSASDLADHDVCGSAEIFADAAFSADTAEDAFINSMEVFSSKSRVRILASNGLDVSFGKCRIYGELVCQCKEPKDVEQFREFDFDSLDTEGIKQKVFETIRDVRARARSSAMPKAGNYDIVLKGEHIREILNYYTDRAHAAYIYPAYSNWKKGESVQPSVSGGEKLNIELVPENPYSAEGVRMVRRPLLADGVLKTIQGDSRFCSYLGTEPTGTYSKVFSSNGEYSLSELEGGGVLEAVSFSNFQMDVFDGHFKGEIRLALLHNADGSVTELSGGSINGSLQDVQGRLKFSKERYRDASYEGPLAVLIPGVPVAGA